jgi:4-amino-4-deoxy-L-arabinose transferase-like glycosyltransferase
MAGLLKGQSVSAEVESTLKKDADDYTWAAAAIGAQNAASYQLATGKPVMAIGGFNGSDPSPTLAQFKQYVSEDRIHYFLGGGGGPGGGTSTTLTTWVEATFKKVTVDGVTLFDLTRPVSGR